MKFKTRLEARKVHIFPTIRLNLMLWRVFEILWDSKSVLTGNNIIGVKSESTIVFSGKFYIEYQNLIDGIH